MKRKNAISIVAIAVILVLTLLVNILGFGYFSNILAQVLGGFTVTNGQSADDLDLVYHKSDYATTDDLVTAKDALGQEIAENGIVLLKRDSQSGFPYAEGTAFSFFSQSSDNWLATGSGSGSGSSVNTNLKTVFEGAGFKVNDTLWTFYKEGNGNASRGAGPIDYGDAQDYSINEVPASKIKDESGLETTFKGTVAAFIFSRLGGEGVDLPRGMNQDAATDADRARHYLEPDSVELGVLQYLQDNPDFDEILLIVNSSNAPELSWTENFSKIHTILDVPCTGKTGLYAVPEILKGSIAPSGRLATTIAADLLASPAAMNIDEGLYYPEGNYPDRTEGNMNYNYVYYAENIYVGYRYYETRYEDAVLGQGNAGDYNYASEVSYPFGFGLTTTTFEWSNFKTEWAGKDCTVSLTVKNTGDLASKDVVEIYAQSPYTDYDRDNGVEKASVVLVGFAKTGVIQPGGSETVKVTFNEERLKSYDAKGAGTYILEGGIYYITAGRDAHAAINNILRVKVPSAQLIPSPAETVAGDADLVATYEPAAEGTVDSVTYGSDTVTGTAITNQFDHATGEGISYLTRNDWVGTFPKTYGEVSDVESPFGNRVNGSDGKAYIWKLDLSREAYNKIRGTDSLNSTPDDSYTDTVRVGEDNGLELIDLRGLDYDDPKWDELIAQLTVNDMVELVSKSGYGTPAAKSVSKPQTSCADGPNGLSSGMPISSGTMIGQTWDTSLAARFGDLVGNDTVLRKIAGWYAPGMNTYRTPFSGRANEYFSEDGFLAGSMAQAEVAAAGARGVVTYIKHFAVNETENHRGDREGNEGLVTWASEQSIREIYLVPFEMSVKSGNHESYYYTNDGEGNFTQHSYTLPNCLGVMTSFNRIGYTWAGGDYNLINNVLRGEWGFIGDVLTDFDNGEFMDTWQALRAGAGTKLNYLGAYDYDGNAFSLSTNMTSAEYHYVKEDIHHLLYTIVNSLAMNGIINGIQTTFYGYYIFIILGFDLIAAVGVALLSIFTIRRIRKSKTIVE